MSSSRYQKLSSWMLGAAIALAATSVGAATSVPQAEPAQSRMDLAANANTETMPGASGTTLQRSYRPLEAGVRKAAMQGPEALRRYIWRTRMIYDYYYPDFALKE